MKTPLVRLLCPRAPRGFARAGVTAFVLGAALLGGCAQLTAADARPGVLPPATLQALAAAGVPAQSLAAVALPLGHAGGGWGHQAERPMQPASTMKLVTSVVALDRLGPNHRGRTTLKSAAPLEDGVLRGDLWLEGGADPDLGISAFWALLVDLRAAGVRQITGDLVVDRRLFRPARPDLGLPPFDEAPEFPYNVVPDALGLAGALLPIEIDSRAGHVAARTVPPLVGIELASRMTLAAGRRCADWDAEWQPPQQAAEGERLRVELHGAFPRDCVRRVALQVVDRQRLEEALFRTLWSGLGGELLGGVRDAGDDAPPPGAHAGGQAGTTANANGGAQAGSSASSPPAAHASSASSGPAAPMRVLAERQSRPWGEVLRGMNKASDNPHTRLLYLSLGVPQMATSPGVPTAALAEQVVRDWFAQRGLATPGLVLDNGSGLSRSERIAPLTLARLLQVAWHGRYASDFIASLPLAGEDGTMRHRLKTSPAAGWARLKTGTLRNVAALAGYVRDAQGRPWAVAMMINHEKARLARPALDALVDALAHSDAPGEWHAGRARGPASANALPGAAGRGGTAGSAGAPELLP